MVRVPTTAPSAFSSMAVADRLTAVGSSLVLTTVRVKVSEALRLPSEAVTVTLITPTSSLSGVPLKVWVAASKLSHEGRAESLLKLAL